MSLVLTEDLMKFIEQSPTAFHAVEAMRQLLLEAGFQELIEAEPWSLEAGRTYFTTRNQSSLIAFKVAEDLADYSFNLVASHSDSPHYRLKERAELQDDKYLRLNTEPYGGMIAQSWLDRPLSLAGRILVQEDDRLTSRLLAFDRDLVVIPNLAIHMNRKMNQGVALNPQVDMIPLLAGKKAQKGDLKALVAEELGLAASAIVDMELSLYHRMPGRIWGAHREFFSAPQLDNLACAYTTLAGFLGEDARHPQTTTVYACFDNEEVGSGTKQGALSTFLSDVLRRIHFELGGDEVSYYQRLASSFLISADNAHAIHPNHPEVMDDTNYPELNGGVVVKTHAGQKYTSDGVSRAVVKMLAKTAGVPLQFFANRSDQAGGSTLGNLAMQQVSVNAVDIGLAQLAMHSSYETAGVEDPAYMRDLIATFYQYRFRPDGPARFQLQAGRV
ncbi:MULTISPECIES: M18 family aminopeptidase [Aerococcus]|uniref:M18 family aminopeptidase n=1 Tax=Aerococcus sanguinicola TaxID=119206 RepID=A0A5N1GKC9_9LACT|nr:MULTISPECIES: M18 family aminopeptidase [Aerococcus]KAA9301262.1 M18 family aminopeptidase [Aerococcus sanguinicola]MDK6369201.1 M18 family aminopeptidase [Aerococcus sp. UMB9870]MDK6679025.1 M18 family aminopeptidase [Aerococcus sp. UMB8608]MDK6687426.1 M18 family aminopeptidase [Aerococcus sp. UMB8623]MDK6940087.1 M18 family aminopeptidase [Aerococcus sp. UMB8487]